MSDHFVVTDETGGEGGLVLGIHSTWNRAVKQSETLDPEEIPNVSIQHWQGSAWVAYWDRNAESPTEWVRSMP